MMFEEAVAYGGNMSTNSSEDQPLTASPGSLVGRYFLGTAQRDCQGCVVAEPAPGVYLVEFFEWIAGGPLDQQLVALEDMTGWHFYDTVEWMRSDFKTRVKASWEAEREAGEAKPDWVAY